MEMIALQTEQQRPKQTLAAGDDGDSRHGETSVPYLPEDIWRYVHSLMPMDAAARAACLSHAFLSSWRCYPKLVLNPGTLLCSNTYTGRKNVRCRIDSILRNHSGIGLKILQLNLWGEESCFPYIDSWLQVAITPGIEELTLFLYQEYNFPCSVLSDGARNSVRSLHLTNCTFRPMPELGPLGSLTRLRLWSVRITGKELECLLSNSHALEHLELSGCNEIIFLKIPSVLHQLSYLKVSGCLDLQVIENKAPNLSTCLLGDKFSKFALGEASQMMKVFSLRCSHAVCYGRAELPSIVPNVESLRLISFNEVMDTPMLPTKFLNLKHLVIQICRWTSSQPYYDYTSLVSFLYASPSLESWCLNAYEDCTEYESVFGGSLHLRQLPEHHHDRLKSVEIVGFKSVKSLVELTCCIVKSAASLERLTLNTHDGFPRCFSENNSDCRNKMCCLIEKAVLEEAPRAVVAIRRYIEDKVPSTAKLTVVEPCPCLRCRCS